MPSEFALEKNLDKEETKDDPLCDRRYCLVRSVFSSFVRVELISDPKTGEMFVRYCE